MVISDWILKGNSTHGLCDTRQNCSGVTGVTQDLVGQQHTLSHAGSAQSAEYLCDGICTVLHSLQEHEGFHSQNLNSKSI